VNGTFCLVLHTHMPYVRRNGTWPSGEDFLFQTWAGSYLRVVELLEDLAERGHREVLTLGMTPLVAHQLDDPYLLGEFHSWLGRCMLRAESQISRYDGPRIREVKDLAGFHWVHHRNLLERFQERYLGAGMGPALRRLSEEGVIELLGGPASHPLLGRIREPAVLDCQLEVGLAEHASRYGTRPRGLWAPECHYRPASADRPGLEEHFHRAGVGHFMVDAPTLTAAGGAAATFQPVLVGDSDVVAFGRDTEATRLVWSAEAGYPGNDWYRDFGCIDEFGFKSFRVSGRNVSPSDKRVYEPAAGEVHARSDARAFAAAICRRLEEYSRESGCAGLMVAGYDTELFGHWWFEGPAFLDEVFGALGEAGVRVTTLERALDEHPPRRRLRLPAGTWGLGGDERSWIAPETEEMWSQLAWTETEMLALVQRTATWRGSDRLIVDQLAREQFLLASSDWPFMVLQGQNPGYARERFRSHLHHFEELRQAILSGPSIEAHALAAEHFERNNAFPALDAGAMS